MTVALIIILMLILLIGVFLFTPMACGVKVFRTAAGKKNDHIYFGFLDIPANLKPRKKKFNKDGKSIFDNDDISSFVDDLKKELSDYKEMYEFSKEELKVLFSSLRKYMKVKAADIDLDVHFGFEDAAITGISTGAIWAVGTAILKIIDALIGVKKINMNVNPDFSEEIFEIYAKINLIIRPIHFIIVLLRAYFAYKRVKNDLSNKINIYKGGA